MSFQSKGGFSGNQLLKYFPPSKWFWTLTPAGVRGDVLAGFTNAALVLPQGIAFAAIAGLPAEYGLYTAMVPTILAALFGSSMVMVSGPTTAISAIVFSALSGSYEIGSPEFVTAAVMLAILVGLIQIGFAMARAGKLASFVSHSVMLGFTMAAAVLIFVSQLKDAFGLEVERGGSVLERLSRLATNAGDIQQAPLIVAAVTFAAALLFSRFAPRLPGYLIAMLVGTLAAQLVPGGEAIRTIGTIDAILPTLVFPSMEIGEVFGLVEAAFAVALVGLLEALAIGRALAPRTGTRFVPNQEVLGQGVSNLVGGFFQAYASSGSFTRSGVNYEAGARSPLGAIASVACLIAMLFVIAPWLSMVPIAAMAGLILLVAVKLIRVSDITHIVQTSRTEVFILVATFLTGILVELELALLLGVLLSFGSFVYRTARPTLQIEGPDPMLAGRIFRDAEEFGLPECPQLMITRFDGPMYFGSAEALEEQFEWLRTERPGQKHIIVNLKGTGDIDLAGVDALVSESKTREAMGGGLYVIARSIKLMARLEQLGLIKEIHGSHLFENKHEAIGLLAPKLDLDICAGCTMPIFNECARNKARAAARLAEKDDA